MCRRFAAGTGPVAIDAERASGYRYSSRAYLIQLRREGSGTALVDPIAFDGLAPLAEALDGVEWILHAATQDLPCLAEVGLRPESLFDTELAGRLLGYPRVGLATLVESRIGKSLRKEHSAVDWSRRPLPEPWLEYAALDVEVLVELREVMVAELEEPGKTEWARQEFEHLLSFEPAQRAEPWRRTSQLHRVRGRRALAAVRELWETRDELARQRDVTPGRILPDAAIIAAASAMPSGKAALMATKGFHGRGADRYAARWVAAIETARELPESELPQRGPRGDGPPTPRTWADRDPVAARRLALSRDVHAGHLRGAQPAHREPDDSRPPAPRAVAAAGHPRPRPARARRSATRWRRTAPGRGSSTWWRPRSPRRSCVPRRSRPRSRPPSSTVVREELPARRAPTRTSLPSPSSPRRLRGDHGPAGLVDRLGHGLDVEHPGVEQPVDPRVHDLLEARVVVDHRRHHDVADRPVEDLGVLRQLVGLQERLGLGDLVVGGHEVAGLGDLRDRLGGDRVDDEVRGGRDALGLGGHAQPGHVTDGAGVARWPASASRRS